MSIEVVTVTYNVDDLYTAAKFSSGDASFEIARLPANAVILRNEPGLLEYYVGDSIEWGAEVAIND